MPQPPDAPIIVEKGRLIAYRLFDVADEIALVQVEGALAADLKSKRLVLARDPARTLAFAAPPLDVVLGKRRLKLPPLPEIDVHVSVRLFDYGTISVSIEIPLEPGVDLATLIPVCADLYESAAVDELADREVDAFFPRIRAAVVGAHERLGPETYTVIFIEELRGKPAARDVLAWPLLAQLIVGEAGSRKMSPELIADILRHTHAYFEDDLAVIDWNSAFVLDPTGCRDIPDILEFATSQLLELRYYDDLFDRELARIYDDLALARRRPGTFRSPYRKLARDTLRRIVELTEFTERVDNALKIIGDFFLARVYDSAVRRFRIPAWRTSIDGKQALIAQAYNLVKGEIESRRSTMLELVVILLIFLELALAFVRR